MRFGLGVPAMGPLAGFNAGFGAQPQGRTFLRPGERLEELDPEELERRMQEVRAAERIRPQAIEEPMPQQVRAPQGRGMFGRVMGVLGNKPYGAEEMGLWDRLSAGREGVNERRSEVRQERRAAQTARAEAERQAQMNAMLASMHDDPRIAQLLQSGAPGASEMAIKQMMTPTAPTQYGFQNIPNVGLLATDPTSGTAQMAYEIPENVRAQSSDNVQSVQILQNGEIAFVTRSGQLQRTGEFARSPTQVTTIGEVPYFIDRTTGTARPISTPEEVGGSRAQISTIQANEEARRRAQQDLPTVVATADQTLSTLQQLRDHPALGFRYGLASIGGLRPALPETPEAEVQALIDQVLGQAFLQAFESLKGGGHITEIEGMKATQAITRLGSQSLSKTAATKAINELIEVTEAGRRRAQATAGGSYAAPPRDQGGRLTYNPETGEFE